MLKAITINNEAFKLDRIDFNLDAEHQIYPIMGESGVGKTRLINFLFLLLSFPNANKTGYYLRQCLNIPLTVEKEQSVVLLEVVNGKKEYELEFFLSPKEKSNALLVTHIADELFFYCKSKRMKPHKVQTLINQVKQRLFYLSDSTLYFPNKNSHINNFSLTNSKLAKVLRDYQQLKDSQQFEELIGDINSILKNTNFIYHHKKAFFKDKRNNSGVVISNLSKGEVKHLSCYLFLRKTELLRDKPDCIYLMDGIENNLHPNAVARLISSFTRRQSQFIVATHSQVFNRLGAENTTYLT